MRIPYGDLRAIINNARAFTGSDDTLPMLTCVQFSAEAGELVTRSTDRYKLLRQRYLPPVEKLDTQPGVELPPPPVEVWPAVNVRAAALKSLLAVLKMNLASWPVRTRDTAPLTVQIGEGEFGRQHLLVDGIKVDLLEASFPDVDRLLEGQPLKHAKDFDGVIAWSPYHLAALDQLRLRSYDKTSPQLKFAIGAADKPVYVTPIDQRDGLTIEGLLMPVKVAG